MGRERYGREKEEKGVRLGGGGRGEGRSGGEEGGGKKGSLDG